VGNTKREKPWRERSFTIFNKEHKNIIQKLRRLIEEPQDLKILQEDKEKKKRKGNNMEARVGVVLLNTFLL